MNIFLKRGLLLSVLILLISCNAPGGNENSVISIKTTLGVIKVKLYDGTPIHRDNFLKLVEAGLYDGVSFHRVIKGFMIQSGDPLTKQGAKTNIPDSLITSTIQSEFNPEYFHKKGALAAAREGNDINPEMRSSATQFYIVQGGRYNDDELTVMEKQINNNIKQALFNTMLKQVADSSRLTGKNLSDGEIQEAASLKMFQYLTSNKDFKISEIQRDIYRKIGGTPRLDGAYTVFGEVIEGLEIIDKIAAVPTNEKDKPVSDIRIIKMKIEKN